MKNSAKIENAISTVESVNSSIIDANALSIEERLNSLVIPERLNAGRDILFRFQLDKSVRYTEKDQKGMRTKFRRLLFGFADDISLYAKMKREEELQKRIKEFITFYVATYVRNDFSVSSMYSSSDQHKINSLQLMIDIIKIKGFVKENALVKETK